MRRAAAALIALQAGWWAWIALPGFFRSDDYFYLEAVHVDRAGLWDWLGRIVYEHFAPGHRLAFYLVDQATPARWLILQLTLVALMAVGLAAYYGALELLFGRSWWLLLPLAAAGFAHQLALPFAWPSSGLQAIPSFAFGSITLYAFVRHHATRRTLWAVVAVAAFSAGLAFYVRMLLVLPLLAFVRVLFLEERVDIRALWRDRWLWIALLAPVALYVNFFFSHHGYDAAPAFSASDLGEFLRNAWLRNITPGFLGLDPDSGRKALVEIGAQALLLAAIAVSVRRKGAAALRAWTYLALMAGATLWLTATGKLGVGGPDVGYDPRYVSDLCWQLPLGVTFALHPRRTLEVGAPWPPSARRPALAVAIACVAALAVAASLASARDQQQAWQPAQTRDWPVNARRSLEDWARAHRRPARVADRTVPSTMVAGDPARYSRVLALLGAPVVVGGAPDAVIDADGQVKPAP